MGRSIPNILLVLPIDNLWGFNWLQVGCYAALGGRRGNVSDE